MSNRRLAVALLAPPLAWTIHLLVVYVVIALFCSSGWGGRNFAMLLVTLFLAGIALASGVLAHRLWVRGKEEAKRDIEPGVHETWDSRLGERGARGLFIAVLAMLMAGLFGFLIITQGLSPLLSPDCQVGFTR
jgi:hypothetical protein